MSTAVLAADVSIVGSGPAGSSAALTLARQGRSVVLIGRRNVAPTGFGESVPPRLSAILNELGLWQKFVQQEHTPCFVTRSAWRTREWDEQDYSMHPDGPWWLLDRTAFNALLTASAREAGATILEAHQAVDVNREPSGEWLVECSTADGRCSVKSTFLIDASGRHGTIGRRLGTLRETYDDLLGLLVFVPAKRMLDPTELYILVEASENGWWYSALLPSNHFVVAFMTDAPILKMQAPNPAVFWMDEFHKTRLTEKRINRGLEGVEPLCISAASVQSESLPRSGFLAVGDALNTFDPLSSQGILNGIESGRRGATAVSSGLAGDALGIQRYFEEEREKFRKYLADRRNYYSRVQRFAKFPFWQKRMDSSSEKPRLQRSSNRRCAS